MKKPSKRVPAVDQYFSIPQLLAHSKDPLGIGGISKSLACTISAIFTIGYRPNTRIGCWITVINPFNRGKA